MRKDDVVLHYRIEGSLGRGGMGEVFLAEDTRLKRRVALKVLPEDLARDPVLLHRFRIEAEAAAKLNHPNIAQVFAIEEARLDDAGSDGPGTVYFITMEYVAGRPLQDHLSGTPLPLESFYDWFVPIVDALDHAHERGVVHRDLKPANVMISNEGIPKVLDFGLARISAESSDETDGGAPTVSLTQAGTVLGTPAYMSPEQATGNRGDHRSDIFSLGVMMYEALAGIRPFTGDHYVSIISSTLKDEPDSVGEHNREVPPTLNRVVRRCLGKDPRSRYQSILDVGHDLVDSRAESAADPPGGMSAGAFRVGKNPSFLQRSGVLAACVLGLVGIVLGVAGLTGFLREEPAAAVRKFQVTLDNLGRDNVAISPDGSMLAYVHGNRLWVRAMDQVEGREIPGTNDVDRVFWSPDSRNIGFLVDRNIWKVATDGGGQIRLCELPEQRLTGVSWGGDGQILFSMIGPSPGGGLYTVSELGGDPVLLVEPDIERSEWGYITPVSLSDFNLRLYAVVRSSDDMEEIAGLSEKYRGNPDLNRFISVAHIVSSRIVAETPGGGQRTLPLEGEFLTVAGYAAGYLLFYRETAQAEGDLWAVPFSPPTGELTGEAFPIARNVNTVSLSDDGAMVYRQAFRSAQQLTLVDRSGRIDRAIGNPQDWIGQPVLSPDEARVVVESVSDGKGALWQYDLASGAGSRLTFADWDYSKAAFTPDGESIVFAVSPRLNQGRFRRVGLLMRMDLEVMDGMALYAADSLNGWAPILSRDGKYLVYFNGLKIQYVSTEPGAKPEVFEEEHRRVWQAALSPDSRYLAHVSAQSGSPEVYVTRFPSGTGKWQVSVNGGWTPHWSPTGKELFYVEDNRMMAVPLMDSSGVRFGQPVPLFDGVRAGAENLRFAGYDVTPDGEKFVLVTNAEEARPVLTIVQNWTREFDR